MPNRIVTTSKFSDFPELTLAQQISYPHIYPFFLRLENRLMQIKGQELSRMSDSERLVKAQMTVAQLLINKPDSLIILMTPLELAAINSELRHHGLIHIENSEDNLNTRISELIHSYGQDVHSYGLLNTLEATELANLMSQQAEPKTSLGRNHVVMAENESVINESKTRSPDLVP